MKLGYRDVQEAASRIAGLVRRTPCLRLEELEHDFVLWAKAENLQAVGAFKARGAMNAVARLKKNERSRGLITYSSGNHAQAVARAARHFGIKAEIAMPLDAPAIKVDAVRSLGASIHLAGTTSLERKAVAEELQRKTGATIIEPFNHPHTIAGQGTATLEFLEQLNHQGAEIDTLIVPVGGGGLVAGACLASERTDIEIVTVEPEGCDSMRQSLMAESLVPVTPASTIADGLRPTAVGQLCLDIVRARRAMSLTVTDDEIGHALVALLSKCHLLVEPSAAASIAAVLKNKISLRDRRVGVLLSGGNVSTELVGKLLEAHGERAKGCE